MDNESLRRMQRMFYLRLSPFFGNDIASKEGGFITPSEESVEHDMRDVLKLWLSLQHTPAGESIANCAWWMVRHMDSENKMGASESLSMIDNLTSFAVSVIGQLIDDQVLAFVEEPDLPKIMLSTMQKFDDNHIEFLSAIEKEFNRKDQEDDDD